MKEGLKTNPRNQKSMKRGVFSENRKNKITKNKDEIKLNY